jgi:hypothetical protein
VTSVRLQRVQQAYDRYTATWHHLGPHRGPCGLCGAPDARHRVADEALVGPFLAGDDLPLLAYDNDLDQAAVAEIVAAGLAYEVARLRARLPRSHQPAGPAADPP